MYAKECIKARQNGQIGWIFILRSEKYTGLKKYITKLIHPRICIECKISWLAPSSSFGSFIPEMLFIISLGTKARAGGVFSQREFIVSTISALVHHYSWCHLGKKPDCLLFCNERKRHIYGFSGALIFHGIFFHSSSILIISNREAALSLPLSNYCDAFYWLLSLPLWSIWHLMKGGFPLIKGTSTTGRDGNFFIISFVVSFHCRCDQFQF